MTAPPADDTGEAHAEPLPDTGAINEPFLGDMDAALSVILAAEREKENGAAKSPANPEPSTTADDASDSATADSLATPLSTALIVAPATSDGAADDSNQQKVADGKAGASTASGSDKASETTSKDGSSVAKSGVDTANAADGSGPTHDEAKEVTDDKAKQEIKQETTDEAKNEANDAKDGIVTDGNVKAVTAKDDLNQVSPPKDELGDAANKADGSAKQLETTSKDGDVVKENGHVKPPPFTYPETFTSFDGRVLQHVYAIGKLEYMIANLQEAANLPVEGDDYNIILLPIVACFTPGVFYIADGPLSQRVDLVAHYKLFRLTPPPNINDKQFTHIPYDFQDVLVAPLDDLPLELMAQKCFHLYQTLLQQVLAAYKKRLSLQSLPPGYIESVSKLVGLRQTDVDCAPAEILRTTLSPSILSDDTAVEALLIDNDLKGVLTMCQGVRDILNRLNPRIQMYKTLRGQPPPLAVWEVVGLTLRLNDLYTCVRRLGRQVLNANHVHLVDQKFLFQLKNGAYMRHLLSKAEAIFNGNRKNGTLVATLTRVLLRHQAPSGYACDSKLVRDLANFVSQGWFAVDQAVLALDEFVTSWVAAELRFRAAYNLPRQNLGEISKSRRLLGKKDAKDAKSATSANSQTNTTTNKPSAPVAAAVQLLAPPRLRSSLVLLVTLGGLASLRTPRKPPPLPLRLSPVPQLARLDSSQLLNNQNLTPAPPQPMTRTRSNSLPVHNPATLGAAAALKVARLNLVRRSPASSAVSPTPQRNLTVFAQSSKNVQKQLLAVAKEDGPARLTAQQRLQQHLRQGTKLGTLVTHQRESLVPVTFDPANPSEYQIRRERATADGTLSPVNVPPHPLASSLPPGGIPSGSLSSLPDLVLREFGQPTMLGKPTMRDVQTRRNTARNSKLTMDEMTEINLSSVLLLGLESTRSLAPLAATTPTTQPSSTLGEVRKCVRFAGVPEYSEEEDLPANYALKILKNFAVIRPLNQHQAFRKKELQLKREESIQWRHQLHQGE